MPTFIEQVLNLLLQFQRSVAALQNLFFYSYIVILNKAKMTWEKITVVNKITDKVKQILPDGLGLFDFILYAFVVTSCYILFQQTDLFHTSSSSYAYLNGHIADYYDYNNKILPGWEYYLPLGYIIFAIW